MARSRLLMDGNRTSRSAVHDPRSPIHVQCFGFFYVRRRPIETRAEETHETILIRGPRAALHGQRSTAPVWPIFWPILSCTTLYQFQKSELVHTLSLLINSLRSLVPVVPVVPCVFCLLFNDVLLFLFSFFPSHTQKAGTNWYNWYSPHF